MRREMICVADDFGLTTEINTSIVHCHLSGVLHGAALMVGQNATSEAVELAKTHPSLQIGWHLHLNDSLPTTLPRWPWGTSPARAGWSLALTPHLRKMVRAEIEQQWAQFQATGLQCAFINSHHHLHAHPFVYHVLQEIIPKNFPGWIRLGSPRAFQPTWRTTLAFGLGAFFFRQRRLHSPWRSPDTLWGIDRTFHMNAVEVRAAMRQLPGGFHEFLFHPRSLTCVDTQCLVALKTMPE